ncbi:MAG TPA: hypothetical protein VGX94_07190 [Terriglobia bacterium]|nr:hypothetical protein [Terriglobia bacterium]
MNPLQNQWVIHRRAVFLPAKGKELPRDRRLIHAPLIISQCFNRLTFFYFEVFAPPLLLRKGTTSSRAEQDRKGFLRLSRADAASHIGAREG